MTFISDLADRAEDFLAGFMRQPYAYAGRIALAVVGVFVLFLVWALVIVLIYAVLVLWMTP